MADFFTQLQNTITNSESNLQLTENGGVGFKSTGNKLVDMNFKTSSYRNLSEREIESDFAGVCAENLAEAIVWAFFSRDVRGGMGERRLFRVCMRFLADNYTSEMKKVLHLVPEYGRWDDLFELCGTKLEKEAVALLLEQLLMDMARAKEGKSVSLLAKWLPSINSHHASTKEKAYKLANLLGLDRYQYQKMTSLLRKQIKTVESQMSANQWGEIDYATVPSKANLIYKGAFLKHDTDRRKQFLEKLSNGETKINAKVLMPHEIVAKYDSHRVDTTLEELWKALPDYIQGKENTIVVADGSGSMCSRVGNSNVTCLDVANALAIYFAERLSGPFKNKYITFSATPRLVNIGSGSLVSKLNIAYQHNECSNTDIKKTFDLILKTAVDNHLKQEELPGRVLIISDMEFDSVTRSYGGWMGHGWKTIETFNKTIFDEIKQDFAQHGYKLPRLVFWNVCSRTNTIPVKENDLGVSLVSGFNPSISKIVFSNKLNPAEILYDQLHDERYLPVWTALSPT